MNICKTRTTNPNTGKPGQPTRYSHGVDAPSHPPITTLPQVIGQNVRAIRTEHGWTQEELAAACRAAGLKWGYRRVLELEAGLVAAGLPTLLRVVAALDALIPTGETPVTLTRLLQTTGAVRLGGAEDETEVPGAVLLRVASGTDPGRVLQPYLHAYEASDTNRRVSNRDGKAPTPTALSRADVRMAQKLGLNQVEYLELCLHLWGRGLEAERSRREQVQGAGPLNAAARGWITNALRRELEEELGRRPK